MAEPVEHHPKPDASSTKHQKSHDNHDGIHTETRIMDAIIDQNNVLHHNSSVTIENLNITDVKQEMCFNCTRDCGPHKTPLADTPWYWYVIIGLMLIIIAMGVGLGTWIFLDESKTRKQRKKVKQRRNSLAGSNNR